MKWVCKRRVVVVGIIISCHGESLLYVGYHNYKTRNLCENKCLWFHLKLLFVMFVTINFCGFGMRVNACIQFVWIDEYSQKSVAHKNFLSSAIVVRSYQ